ncbi:uncharacterized mitochondrial protein AtMg00810-like [Euphorbia lathyris]|uniref:uncharacterized mitochondrial protein AtMg00810-like n=1 Tax=Euphorbia lathyris TaxID=212925 RepID=UPI00331387D5
MGSNDNLIDDVKSFLHKLFTIKDLGSAKYFLGIEIAHSSTGILLSQTKYINDIIQDAGLIDATTVANPMTHSIILSEPGLPLTDPFVYRRLIGRLLYLQFTRPDLTFVTQQLSQYMQTPCDHHLKAVLHVLRYLKGTSHFGLLYPSSSDLNIVTAYCDANWGKCKETRRSITGYCIFLGSSLISWKTKKQNTVSRSSAEVEYRSMATTSCELKWIQYILGDLGVHIKLPITMHCDSKSVITLAQNPVSHDITKHVDIDYHLIREHVANGFIQTPYIFTTQQLADLFTKSISLEHMAPALSKMNFVDISPVSS